jgi:hypothetical protein
VIAKIFPRRGQDGAHRVQPVDTRSKADPGFVSILARQSAHLFPPHIGGIADDDIVPTAGERGEVIGSHDPHPVGQRQAAYIAPAHAQRLRGDIDRVHRGARKRPGTRERDCARAGADVENAAHAARFDPGFEPVLDQLRDRGSRHQHALIHIQFESRKECPVGQIGERQALLDSPLEERVDARAPARRQRGAVGGAAGRVGQTRREEYELGGFVPRIVRAMAEMKTGAAHGPCATLDGVAHRLGCRMG